MDDIFFVGDELAAAAWRLAGVHTMTVDAADTDATLDDIPAEARLVMLSSTHAASLAMDELTARIRRGKPPIMVIGDAAGRQPLPDFVTLLRRRLGVAV